MATLREIASYCGVSVPTASRVLSGDDRRISRETIRRVKEAAQRLGYSPSAAARMLRTGATYNVVLAYVQQRLNPGFAAAPAQLVAERLGSIGYRLDVRKAPTNEALLETLRRLVQAKAADAYVLWGLESEVEEQGLLLESLGQTFIARGYYEKHPDWLQADFDHRGMMAQTLDKLLELGHQRIALLSHSGNEPYAVNFCGAYGDIVSKRLGRPVPEDWKWTFEETADSGNELVTKIERLLAGLVEECPTAIAVGEGGSAIPGVEAELLAHGIRVGDAPGQFAVAGVGGWPGNRMITGPTWVYDGAAEYELIDRIIDNQLMPMLDRSAEPQGIVRYLPELRRYAPKPDVWSTGALTINPDWAKRPGG